MRQLVATFLILTFIVATPSYAPNWTVCAVGCDFTSIQDAVDASISGDTIQLGPETFFEHVCVSNTGEVTEDPPLPAWLPPFSLSILGAGADVTVVNGTFRVGTACSFFCGWLGNEYGPDIYFRCGSVSLILEDMTVQNSPDCGVVVSGAEDSGASVTIENSVVRENECGILQGGYSGITITTTTIAGNEGHGYVGGSRHSGSSFETTTINDNGDCGVYLFDGRGTVAISNSTVSGNSAGVVLSRYSYHQVAISQSTIADNSGPGLLRTPYYGYYRSSIDVAASIVANNEQDNCWTTSGGHNLSSELCGSAEPSDILETDPQLMPLTDNGGPTATHAITLGTAAIDAGALECVSTDQRGVARPLDGDGDGVAKCDVGAFEYAPPAALVRLLIDQVESLDLPHGIENSLVAKLNVALLVLGDVAVGNDGAAIHALNAFINAVKAQHAKKITPVDAEALINAAQEIISRT